MLPFLSVAQQESGTWKNYILVSGRIKQKFIQSMQSDCSNRTSAGKNGTWKAIHEYLLVRQGFSKKEA